MIRVLFKFAKTPTDVVVIDTTSNSGNYKELSPFVLPAPPAKNLENLWQFSKVYHHHLWNGEPSEQWYEWRDKGWANPRAIRYPMGKGAVPEYSLWDGEKLDYIQARKKIYAPEYAKNVALTDSYKALQEQYKECRLHDTDLVLLDYDAYDHAALNMSLIDVINNPKYKMGHAFVLMMLLVDLFEECIHS